MATGAKKSLFVNIILGVLITVGSLVGATFLTMGVIIFMNIVMVGRCLPQTLALTPFALIVPLLFFLAFWLWRKPPEKRVPWAAFSVLMLAVFCTGWILFHWGPAAAKNHLWREYDYPASARSAGRNAKLAQEVRFSELKEKDSTPIYSSNLDELLSYDRNLTDDTEVTFTFISATTSGFTFETIHKRCGEAFTFTE